MAYNTKQIVKDKDGNPISQYYNPVTDQYEPVEGNSGGNKVVVQNNDLSLIPILDKLSQLTGTVIDEETRKTNEGIRKADETLRVNAETSRKNAENTRVTSETDRVTKETDRVAKETVRVDAEKVRVSNENTRKTDETKRSSNENLRKSNEVTRISNENLRIALYELITQKLNDGEFKGVKGDTGNGLEYNWIGTELGVRVVGQTNYVYVNLKGEKGDTGNIDNLTKKHVTDALGYTPPEIDTITEVIDNLESSSKISALSANMGKELFQYVSSGKTLVAGAITDKGVTTKPTDTFNTMGENIRAIETGGKMLVIRGQTTNEPRGFGLGNHTVPVVIPNVSFLPTWIIYTGYNSKIWSTELSGSHSFNNASGNIVIFWSLSPYGSFIQEGEIWFQGGAQKEYVLFRADISTNSVKYDRTTKVLQFNVAVQVSKHSDTQISASANLGRGNIYIGN